MERPITFENHEQRLLGILHIPDGDSDKSPGVVLCHGFTGNRSEAHFIFVKLARALCAKGIAVLRFDFRGSGDSEGDFEDMTISGEISDALRAVEVLSEQPRIDRDRIGILGFSLGGCVAACVAGTSSSVRTTVLWAPAHDPESHWGDLATSSNAFPYEFAGGFLLGRQFIDELPTIRPLEEIAGASGPVLIVHGSEDQAVRVESSENYVRALSDAGIPCERKVIVGADHTFANSGHERDAIDRSVAWFEEHIGGAESQPGRARGMTYADAGVDIEAQTASVRKIKKFVRNTHTLRVLADIGSFGGLFEAEFCGYTNPVLVASTDSVGTKVKIAVDANKHDTVGIDIVNHCVNDILVMGAQPLFFLDYIGIGKHVTDTVVDIVSGLAHACSDAGCALLGGEMAELREIYAAGDYDLAGTIVGVVEKSEILDGSDIVPGDVVLGLGSDGLHTNGYSLARKLCFERAGWSVDTHIDEWGTTVGGELLKPHRCYLKPVKPLLENAMLHGIAHITGGGITDNLPRILPEECAARIRPDSWPVAPVFRKLIELGEMEPAEALHTFNMGIGMVLVVSQGNADEVSRNLEAAGERVWKIGAIVDGAGDVQYG